MNTTTKALLASLGLAGVLGTLILVARPSSGTTCIKALLTCDFYINQARKEELSRTGILPIGNYARLSIPADMCKNETGDVEVVVFPGRDAGATSLMPDDVRMCDVGALDQKQQYPSIAPFRCAANPAKGQCERRVARISEDAKEEWVLADETTMGPGEFRGPDCQLRPCVELYGAPWKSGGP